MNNFLLVYDRQAGRLLEEKTYEVRAEAMRARFEYEEKYLDHPHNIEVVVLGAESREQLLKTHARYFLTLPELVAGIA